MRPRRARSDQAGTTLVEFLIVIAIVGLVVLIVAPASARVYDQAQVSAARSALVNLYSGARVSARLSNRTMVLRLADDQVIVERNSLTGSAKDTLSVTDLQNRYGVFVSGPDSIRIDPRGILETNLATAAKFFVFRGSRVDSVVLASYGRIIR